MYVYIYNIHDVTTYIYIYNHHFIQYMNTYTLIHIAYPWKSFEPSESLDSTDVPPPSSQAVQGNVPMGVTCVWAVTMGCPSTDRTLARTLGRTEVGGFPARGKAKIWKFELMTPRVLKCSLDGT